MKDLNSTNKHFHLIAALFVIIIIYFHSGVCFADPTTVDEYKLGIKSENEGNHTTAIKHFKKSINLSPEWILPYIKLCEIMNNIEKNPKEIIRFLVKAIKLSKNNPRLRYLLGITYSRLGEINKACKQYSFALSLKKNYSKVYKPYAECLVKEKKLQKAAVFYRKIQSKKPEDVWVIFQLTKIFEKTDLNELAEEEYKKLEELYPHNAYYLIQIAEFYKRWGKQELFNKYLEKARTRRGIPPKRQMRNLK